MLDKELQGGAFTFLDPFARGKSVGLALWFCILGLRRDLFAIAGLGCLGREQSCDPSVMLFFIKLTPFEGVAKAGNGNSCEGS